MRLHMRISRLIFKSEMNVYLPKDLQAQVDSYKNQVNWSEVAQQAFVQKISQLAAHKKDKTMSDILTRLRASKAATENEMTIAGTEAGRKWCENRAEYIQIKRLAGMRDALPLDFDRFMESEESAALNIAAWACKGNFDTPYSWDEANQFWGKRGVGASTEQIEDLDYVTAFHDAVETFWDKIADEID